MQESDREQHLRYMLEHGNTRDALILLNWMSEFRYSALLRFDEQWLRYVEVYDRQNPAITKADDLLVSASYCMFVRDTGKPVEIRDSLTDPRVEGHPKRLVVRSYCGMPLLDRDGGAFGTVCHFDAEIRPITVPTMDGLGMFARIIHSLPHRVFDVPYGA